MLVRDTIKKIKEEVEKKGFNIEGAKHNIEEGYFIIHFIKNLSDGKAVIYSKIIPELVFYHIEDQDLIHDIIKDLEDEEEKRKKI